MEVQLKELIDKIKTEGILEAEKNAEQMRKQAEKDASSIIAEANIKAKAMLENAKKEAEKFEITGKQAITQAGRDLILKIKSEITSIFEAIIHNDIKDSITQDVLKDVIIKLINTWTDKGITDIKILLSENDRNSIQKYFMQKLSNRLKEGVELSTFQGIKSGFRIMEKDGSAYYDITDSGIAEVLSSYLNPMLKDCINQTIDDRGKA